MKKKPNPYKVCNCEHCRHRHCNRKKGKRDYVKWLKKRMRRFWKGSNKGEKFGGYTD